MCKTVKTFELMAEARTQLLGSTPHNQAHFVAVQTATVPANEAPVPAFQAAAAASHQAVTTTATLVAEVLHALRLQQAAILVPSTQPGQPAAAATITTNTTSGSPQQQLADSEAAQQQLGEMAERLALVVGEVERLRTEREELSYQLRHVRDTLLTGSNSAPTGFSWGTGGTQPSLDSLQPTQQQQQQQLQACREESDRRIQLEVDARLEVQRQLEAAKAAVAAANAAVEASQAQAARATDEADKLRRQRDKAARELQQAAEDRLRDSALAAAVQGRRASLSPPPATWADERRTLEHQLEAAQAATTHAQERLQYLLVERDAIAEELEAARQRLKVGGVGDGEHEQQQEAGAAAASESPASPGVEGPEASFKILEIPLDAPEEEELLLSPVSAAEDKPEAPAGGAETLLAPPAVTAPASAPAAAPAPVQQQQQQQQQQPPQQPALAAQQPAAVAFSGLSNGLGAVGAGRDGATRSSGGRIPPEAVAALREMAAALVGAPAEEIKELTVSGVGVGVGAV